MKTLLSLLILALIGAGVYFAFFDREPDTDLGEGLHQAVNTGAAKMDQAVDNTRDAFDADADADFDIDINTDKIKDELAHAGRVVREKTGEAGRAVASTLSDATVTGAVKSKLIADSDLNGLTIDVDTNDGVVTLNGTVHSYGDIAKAMSIALRTDGVKKVVSTLQVKQ